VIARGVAAGALTVVLLLGGVGCAGSPAPERGVVEAADQLRVGLTEWSVETGPAVAAVGHVTLVVTNTGATAHDLVVHGTRGTWRTPVLAPGERADVAIETAAGESLHLECTVTGHHAQGMHAELRVAALADERSRPSAS
jgi:hypothetical protein